LEFDIANRTATIWDGGNKSFTFTNEKQLGQAVVFVLQHPQETRNQYLYVASVETTQNEILAALEEISGESWTVTKTTTDAQVTEAVKKLTAGDFSGALSLARSTAFGNTQGLHSNYAKEEKLANDILGLSLEDVQDVVKRVLNK
jgi:predicted Zn-dependent peptidase